MTTESKQRVPREEGAEFGPDTIKRGMREGGRATIEAIVEEELEAAPGAGRWARVGETRRGYRHGVRPRTLTTSLGPTPLAMPRARLL
jgi:transposase-like protein